MDLKDYYSILELPPSATTEEIKKAYRRLALMYHPDKKENDPYASARFAEIKEAYETLSNPLQKDLYLQQRWYMQSQGQRFRQEVATPVTLLKQMLELHRQVSRMDAHRRYHQGVYESITQVLTDEHIETLNKFDERDINQQIILLALKSGRDLPLDLVVSLAERLKNIQATADSTKVINDFVLQQRRADTWEKRKVWVVLIAVLLICLAIFLSTR